MNSRPHWRDAGEATAWLVGKNSLRGVLLLLARLPLLHAKVIERLGGLRGGASVYRCLEQLRGSGLVGVLQPALRPGHSPRLYYLSDLGLATIALDQGVEPGHLARKNHLRGSDLVDRLPGLPQLVACYELLAAVAASRPGGPNLLAWERPWRRHFRRPAFKAPTRVELPAYAALSWEGKAAAFLLIPDLATFPLRAYHTTLGRLLLLRSAQGSRFPTLVVATTDRRRAAAWGQMLEDSRRARFEAPLPVCVATWEDLPGGIEGLARFMGSFQPPAEGLSHRIQLERLRSRRPCSRVPCLVGDALSMTSAALRAGNTLGRAAIGLSPTDRALLDFVGRHPFQPPERLASVLGWQVKWARQLRNRLMARGLMRLLGPEEVGADFGALELVELTEAGLALVAAQQGLPLAAAVRYNGLAGGTPDNPIGSRRQLVAHLSHALGVDGILVDLMETARRAVASANDEALVEWRNAAACSRRHLRPDGYGIYRRGGRLYGFFLEYDRGTMSARDYLQKFAAYFEYLTIGSFSRDYEGFPTILVVTKDRMAEDRIARAACAAAVGRGVAIPLLLTCEWRIFLDPGNPRGLLGPIWREPGSTRRRHWLPHGETGYCVREGSLQVAQEQLPGGASVAAR